MIISTHKSWEALIHSIRMVASRRIIVAEEESRNVGAIQGILVATISRPRARHGESLTVVRSHH